MARARISDEPIKRRDPVMDVSIDVPVDMHIALELYYVSIGPDIIASCIVINKKHKYMCKRNPRVFAS